MEASPRKKRLPCRTTFRDGSVEAQGKEQGPIVLLLCSGFSQVRTSRSCRWCCTSRSTSPRRVRLVGLLADSKTCRSGWTPSSKSMVKRHSPSPLLWHRSRRLMEWTMASQPNPTVTGGGYVSLPWALWPARPSRGRAVRVSEPPRPGVCVCV